MARRVQVIIGAAGVAAIGLLLWPIFAAGEPLLPVALIIFLAAGAALVYFALKSGARWSRYALMGIIPGFLIGGFGLGSLVWFGGAGGSGGWEELVAVVAGIMGAFLGAIAGGVCGGLIGYRKDRSARR